MIGIPEVVQSQILSSFLDGKSISTYFHVLLCNSSLRSSAFHLIRDALVDRYLNLAKSEHFAKHNDEVRDVLDIIREDIRTCTENGRAAIDVVGVGHQIDTSSDDGCLSVTNISEWCAIIDYFDRMRARSGEWAGVCTVWCGELVTQNFGTIQQACISTAFWTVTAMDHFYDQLELNNHYLTHPMKHDASLMEMSYGELDVTSSTSDDIAFQRIIYSLNSDAGSPRYSVLVPSHMEYEPTLGFALNDHASQRENLVCYWDGNDRGDFEYSLSHLGENAIRILNRLDNSG